MDLSITFEVEERKLAAAGRHRVTKPGGYRWYFMKASSEFDGSVGKGEGACLRRVGWRDRTQYDYAGSGVPKEADEETWRAQPDMPACQFRCWVPSVTGGLKRDLQTLHNVLRLKAVAKRANSARTLAKPRRRNRRALSWSFSMPNVGSLSTLRRAYNRRAVSVPIHCRCFRSRTSVGPIHSARPECTSWVQSP